MSLPLKWWDGGSGTFRDRCDVLCHCWQLPPPASLRCSPRDTARPVCGTPSTSKSPRSPAIRVFETASCSNQARHPARLQGQSAACIAWAFAGSLAAASHGVVRISAAQAVRSLQERSRNYRHVSSTVTCCTGRLQTGKTASFGIRVPASEQRSASGPLPARRPRCVPQFIGPGRPVRSVVGPS